MPIDPSFIGRTYPPTAPYEVGREKIREFADAIGASHPAHRDPAAAHALGHRDVFAPPTFPVVLTIGDSGSQVFDDPDLGIDFSRLVHGDQRFRYTRPIYAGDRLSCVCTIEDITFRAGNDFLVTRTELFAEDAEPVVTVWSKMVIRGEK